MCFISRIYSFKFYKSLKATFAAFHISSDQPQSEEGQLSRPLKPLSVFYTTVEQEKTISEGL